MRQGLIVILVVLGSVLVAACGSEDEAQTVDEELSVKTVEVTREVTVERTIVLGAEGTNQRAGGETAREELPGPARPLETDIKREVGKTATLDNGNNVTVFSGQSGVTSEESVYKARPGMDFYVIESEVCVSESASEPSYFTPREFSLLNGDNVRRMASVPTKLPALRGSSVEPGECERGYITFQIEDGEEPRAVVYEGSSVVEWELDED